MEHYFSAVDNERFGSGSKVYHNVACRFGVMTGNLWDPVPVFPPRPSSSKVFHIISLCV